MASNFVLPYSSRPNLTQVRPSLGRSWSPVFVLLLLLAHGLLTSSQGGIITSVADLSLFSPGSPNRVPGNITGLAWAPDGSLYVSDRNTYTVRRVNASSGVVTTVAGNGNPGVPPGNFGGNSTTSSIGPPTGVALAANGSLYIGDANGVLWSLQPLSLGASSSLLVPVAGNISFEEAISREILPPGFYTKLTSVIAVATCSVISPGCDGSIYFVQLDGYYRASTFGVISKIVSYAGFATGGVVSLAADLNGGVYIAIEREHRVYYDPGGGSAIIIVAGTHNISSAAPIVASGMLGNATSINRPVALALGPDGSLFIADEGYNVVWRLNTASGIITIVAGNGSSGATSAGALATSTPLTSPTALAVASDGRLYIGGSGTNEILMVTFFSPPPPPLAGPPSPLAGPPSPLAGPPPSALPPPPSPLAGPPPSALPPPPSPLAGPPPSVLPPPPSPLAGPSSALAGPPSPLAGPPPSALPPPSSLSPPPGNNATGRGAAATVPVPDASTKSSAVGAAVGGAVGGIAALLVVAGAVFIWRRKRRAEPDFDPENRPGAPQSFLGGYPPLADLKKPDPLPLDDPKSAFVPYPPSKLASEGFSGGWSSSGLDNSTLSGASSGGASRLTSNGGASTGGPRPSITDQTALVPALPALPPSEPLPMPAGPVAVPMSGPPEPTPSTWTAAMAMGTVPPIKGLQPEDIFVRTVAPYFRWCTEPVVASFPVEEGVTTGLDGQVQPAVRLTREELADQLELLSDGLIDRGASAFVFRARWPSRFGPGGILAVKVLRDLAIKEHVESFAYESGVLSRLRHPNIVRMYGYCLEPPSVCVILELLPGSMAGKLYPQGETRYRLPMDQVLRLSRDVAAGLSEIHTLKDLQADTTAGDSAQKIVVHRDLKPGNVLLNSRGQAKISDFGLAREASGTKMTTTTFGHANTGTHIGVGTLRYMAPELLANTGFGKVSASVDLYSLAMIMWELVNGCVPWTGRQDFTIPTLVVAGKRPNVPGGPSGAGMGRITGEVASAFSKVPGFADLIRHCWHQDARVRPSAAEVHANLEQMLQQLTEPNTV